MTDWIGQGFGILAIVFGFVSYQVKTQRSLLLVQSLTAVAFCAHYGLLGAFPAMVMNALNIVRNVVYDHRNQRNDTRPAVPILFAVLQATMCLLTWNAWYCVFILVGIVANTLFMSLQNPQTVRISILFTSIIILVYDLFASAYGGALYESVALISAAIGIWRMAQKEKKEL